MAHPQERLEHHHRARRLLGEEGAELHTHEVHIRRAHNKGFIARHDMRDREGHPPTDGQASEREYVLANKAAMLAHLDQHMSDPDAGPPDGGPPPPPPGGPGGPPPPPPPGADDGP
jgi:hypothetical protein